MYIMCMHQSGTIWPGYLFENYIQFPALIITPTLYVYLSTDDVSIYVRIYYIYIYIYIYIFILTVSIIFAICCT